MSAESALAAAQSAAEAVEEIAAEVSAAAGEEVRAEATNETESIVPEVSENERREAVRVEHPEGQGFFRGSVEEMSDAEAEEIARGQLARSGLLKGQRVRAGSEG